MPVALAGLGSLILTASLGCKKPPPPPDDDIVNGNRKAAAHVCAQPDSLPCHVAHVTDSDPLARTKAIDSLIHAWDVAKKDGDTDKYRKAVSIDLAKEWRSGLLKPDEQKKIGVLLADLGDPRLVPDFRASLETLKDGQEEVALLAVRAIVAGAGAAEADEKKKVGAALLGVLGKVKWDVAKSAEVGNAVTDALGSLALEGTAEKLVEVLQVKNDGEDTTPTKALTASQVAAARALGKMQAKTSASAMVDVLFDDLSRMVKRWDSATYANVNKGAVSTDAVATAIRAALIEMGDVGVDALAPYALADETDGKVKAVAAKFVGFVPLYDVAPRPLAYADFAAAGLSRIATPAVVKRLEAAARAEGTIPETRERILRVMLTAPVDPLLESALKEGVPRLSPGGQAIVLGDVVNANSSTYVEWLLTIGSDAKAESKLRDLAREAAMWLATKEQQAAVVKSFDPRALGNHGPPYARAYGPTSQNCDDAAIDKGLACRDDAKDAYVVWRELPFTAKDVLTTVGELTTTCEAKASCYFDEARKAQDVLKLGSYSTPSVDEAKARIRLRKSITMLGEVGGESDWLTVVAGLSKFSDYEVQDYVARALVAAFPKGNAKVVSALEAVVAKARPVKVPGSTVPPPPVPSSDFIPERELIAIETGMSVLRLRLKP